MSATVKLPEFCISKAAVGRRLASVILRAQEADLTPEAFAATVSAVLDSCVTGDYDETKYADADVEILETEQAEVKKSIRRSESARKAAARRRELKEQRMKAEQVVNEAATSSAPEEAVTESAEHIPADSDKPRKRRRRNRRRRRNNK